MKKIIEVTGCRFCPYSVQITKGLGRNTKIFRYCKSTFGPSGNLQYLELEQIDKECPLEDYDEQLPEKPTDTA